MAMPLKTIQESLSKLNNWGLEMDMIMKEFNFDSFKEAIEFVNKVKDVAERNEHYPDIVITRNCVRLSLRTAEEKGLSSKDFEVAGEIDKI